MRRRQGFTLVELMVAMALIMFIMAILSQAFMTAMGTFRNLKAAGDMAESLRATTQQLQRDLSSDHFEGKKRLSNPYFWVNGPPEQGYFMLWQNSGGTSEGKDFDGIGSFRNTGSVLAFTVKTRGNQMGDFLSAGGPLNGLTTFGPIESRYQSGTSAYNYQWAEVVWFLVPQPDVTVIDPNTGTGPFQLFTLVRRQRLAVPDNSLVTPALTYANQSQYLTAYGGMQTPPMQPTPNCLELSCWGNPAPPPVPPQPPMAVSPGSLYFNSPTDLTVPARRFGAGNPGIVPNPFIPIGSEVNTLIALGSQQNPPVVNPGLTLLSGSDIQLTNVVSFDVRLLPLYPNGTSPLSSLDPFTTLVNPNTGQLAPPFSSFNNSNPNYPLPVAVFDTWSSVKDSMSDFSQWSTNGAANPTPATSIPLWNAGTVSYTPGYPNPPTFNGTTNTITLTGSGPIIQAIQISLRIWDDKTNQTRQVTMVQAM